MEGNDIGTPLTRPDFSFDWHVSYQRVSPARFSSIEKPFHLELWGFQVLLPECLRPASGVLCFQQASLIENHLTPG